MPEPIWDRDLAVIQTPAAEWILPGYIALLPERAVAIASALLSLRRTAS